MQQDQIHARVMKTVVFYRKQYSTSTTLTPPAPTTDTFPTDPTVAPTNPPTTNPPTTNPPTTDPPTTDPPTSNNLLLNADFESGLANWDLTGCGNGTATSVNEASSGTKALKLSGDTICTGQAVASSGAGNHTLTCDVKNIGGKYADISLYADGTNVDYKSISGNSFSSITLSGNVAASTQSLFVYFYSEAGGDVVIDNCVLSSGAASPTPPTTPPTPPANSNLLNNPSFENSLAAWDLIGCGNGTFTNSADASDGSSALELATNTVCVGQGVPTSGEGTYTLTCDVKNVGGRYADISFYGDFSVVDYKAITSSTYSQISLTGNIAASAENLFVYIYQDGAGSVSCR